MLFPPRGCRGPRLSPPWARPRGRRDPPPRPTPPRVGGPPGPDVGPPPVFAPGKKEDKGGEKKKEGKERMKGGFWRVFFPRGKGLGGKLF